MKRPPVYRRGSQFDLPMTPMIDVVFQLIIFFLCTTRFSPIERVLPMQLDLPGAEGLATEVTPELQDLTEIVIVLQGDRDNLGMTLNGRPLATLGELRNALISLGKIRLDVPVIVDPGPDVRISRVIDIYDLCREIGFVRIQFAAPATT